MVCCFINNYYDYQLIIIIIIIIIIITLKLTIISQYCFRTVVPSQAPGNFTVTSQTSTSILASWQHPSTSDSAVITGYKIFYKRKGSLGSVYTLLIDDATKLSINVTGLLKYTEYEFQILAFTSAGDGANSSSVTERTKEDGNEAISSLICFYVIDFSKD